MNRIIIFSWLLIGIAGCTSPPEQPSSANEFGEAVPTLSAEQLDLARIQTGSPEKRSFSEVISCTGAVEAPPQNIIQVHAPITAFVREVSLKPGRRVLKGAKLLTLEHPELIRIQRDFLEAHARLQANEAFLERTEKLAQTDAASEQSLEQARADFRIARARYRGLKAELEFLGLPVAPLEEEGVVQASLPVYARSTAIVDRVGVNTGQLVHPEDLLYRLVNLDHLHLELKVFATDLARVRIGQAIEAIVPGTRDTIQGEVYLIGPSIDPQSRTALVHGHFTSAGKKSVPGTFLQARILLDEEKYWAVPEGALIKEGESSYVFLIENGQVSRQEVRVGPTFNGWVALPDWDPSKGGGNLVLQGAYYLRNLQAG